MDRRTNSNSQSGALMQFLWFHLVSMDNDLETQRFQSKIDEDIARLEQYKNR
jgi:hypothetical protein